mgnify:CR=1 FL=1
MGKVSMKGVIDMHVHTNPDLRTRAYDDFELCDAAVRVGARAIVIKTHLGYTANRAYLTNRYNERVHGKNDFTMFGSVVLNSCIGGINPVAVENGQRWYGCLPPPPGTTWKSWASLRQAAWTW